ncbi:molybdenum cofactor guanylyltransferase MobA [Rhodopseudomonas sp. B29]|uniref:molybdenum cofactor guanylyltransferase MobA n=1 Tax=Rhodopseudomonas sp. B29 TaxID=95607 RepID=UPI00034DABAA|nr:molybdenum cofactor guanylyltransferase MobA [Rhodopseudomonas sp. B29]
MTEAPLPAIVLAGGLARRMGGGDKPLHSVGGRSLLARVIERLQPQCGALALNANGDAERFADYGLPVIADSIDGFAGPLAGVLAGLDWAAGSEPNAAFLLSAPADCPFLPADLVARLRLAQRETDADIVTASSGGRRHPVVALWRIGLRDALRRSLSTEGSRKVGSFVARFAHADVEWPVTPFDPFFNANTPDDLAEAERIAATYGA